MPHFYAVAPVSSAKWSTATFIFCELHNEISPSVLIDTVHSLTLRSKYLSSGMQSLGNLFGGAAEPPPPPSFTDSLRQEFGLDFKKVRIRKVMFGN